MRATVTQSVVGDELAELYLRLPNHAGMKARPRETVAAYFSDLRDLSADSFRAACKRVRMEDAFFPKVSTIRRYAQEWTQRNPESAAFALTSDGSRCRVCGATWREEPRWRPRIDERGRVLTEVRDGVVVVLLEQPAYARLYCDCSAKADCFPDPDLGTPAAVAPVAGSYLDRRAPLVQRRPLVQPA